MKAVVAAFNQEKALVGAFTVITNLRMELFEALPGTGTSPRGSPRCAGSRAGTPPPRGPSSAGAEPGTGRTTRRTSTGTRGTPAGG